MSGKSAVPGPGARASRPSVPGGARPPSARATVPGTKPGQSGTAKPPVSNAVAKEAAVLAAAALPASPFERFSRLISRRPAIVLGICSVLIVCEVIVITYFFDQYKAPVETKYYNRAKFTSRDLDAKSIEKIPTDSIASGIKSPAEEAFGADIPEKAGTTDEEQRVSKELK